LSDGLYYILFNANSYFGETLSNYNGTPTSSGAWPYSTINVQDNSQIEEGDSDTFNYRWSGYFTPDSSGTWNFRTNSDDTSLVYIGSAGTSVSTYLSTLQGGSAYNASGNGLVVNNAGLHGDVTRTGSISLTSGNVYPFVAYFGENGGGATMVFNYGKGNYNLSNVSSAGGYFTNDQASGVASSGAITFNGAVTLTGSSTMTGDTQFASTLTGGSNELTVTGDLDLDGAASGLTSVSVSGTSDLDANITTSGSQTYTGAITLTANTTLTSTSDAISASTIDGGYDLTIASGAAQSLTSAIGSSTALTSINVSTTSGNLTLGDDITVTGTGTDAMIFNAGSSTAAGTSTGGNIIISGSPTFTTGSGGRMTYYTGSVSGSTGLTSLIGSGSHRFRYNSDETTTNYSAALSSGKYAIYREQPTLTITADDETVTYSTTPGESVTITGMQNGDASATVVTTDASISISGDTSTSGNYIVGDHTITPSVAASTYGYGFSYSTGTLTVDAKALTISGITASNKTYNGNTTATIDVDSATFTGLVDGDDVTVSATGTFDNENVGTGKTVTLVETNAGDDVGNYNITNQGTTTADVTQKDLTISGITASNKTYDGTVSATTDDSGATFTGLVTVDGVADDVTVSSTGTFDNKNVGVGKEVTLVETTGGDDVGNYNITNQGTTTADVTQKDLTISGITASNKTYDGTVSATTDDSGATFTGLVTVDGVADDVTVSSTGTFDNKNVGVGKEVTLVETTGGDDVGNYNITNQGTTTADVTQKDLTISGITASNKTYDGTVSATTDDSGATFTGLVTVDGVADDVTVSSTGTFDNKNVGVGKEVTLVETTGGDDVGNYNITNQGTTTADVTQKDLTISGITASNKTYDGTVSATTDDSGATFTGLVTVDGVADDVTVSSTGTFDNKNVGVGKEVTLVETTGGDDVGNYNITNQGTTTADVTQKDLTISGITASNKTYDGTVSATTDDSGATFTGLVTVDGVADDVTVSSTGTFDNKNVGVGKEVTLVETTGGDDVGNYNITNQGTTTADVTQKDLTISGITASNKTYDGTVSATTDDSGATFTGLVTVDGVADDVTVSSTGTFDNKNVGVGKEVTLVETTGGDDVGNYNITNQGTTTADVTQKDLTISGITASNKTYDGTVSATTDDSGATFTGLVTVDGVADDVTVSSTGTFDNKNVGVGKEVTLVETTGGDDVGNYNITNQGTTTADVTQKDLTISGITASNKTYDGTVSATTDDSGATFTGLVTVDGVADDVTVSSTGTFDNKNVGVGKEVTLVETTGGDDVGNYNITNQGTTTADVTQKDLTISGITASNKTYDGTVSATTDDSGATFTGLVTVDGVADDVTVSSTGTFDNKNVGVGKEVTLVETTGGDDVGNYNITNQGTTTADVTQKDLTISGITASNKTYDGTVSATTDDSGATFTGLVTVDGVADDVTVSSTGTFDNKNVGVGKEVTLVETTGGDDVGNYNITNQGTTTADVTQKDLTISGITASNKTYDGTVSATTDDSGATFTGLVTVDGVADDVTVSSTGTFDNKNVGVGKEVTLVETTGGDDVGNYNITNQGTTTADVTQKDLTISGITASNKTYDGTVSATTDDSGATFTGLVTVDGVADDVTVSSTGTFDNKNVGVGKEVTLVETTGGDDVGNYNITNQGTTTADVTQKDLTISGITASNKTYDGTVSATTDDSGATFTGLVTVDGVADDVTVSSTGTFDNKNVGVGKEVTLVETTGGDDVGNYNITNQGTTTADVTQKDLTISGITASNKTYDGTVSATTDDSGATFTGLVTVDGVADDVTVSSTGTFDNKNVGVGKEVTLVETTGGDDVGNYNITNQGTTTADVTQKDLTISGITASNKTYDGTVSATTDDSGATFTGLVTVDGVADDVTVSSTGTFDNKNVGVGKEVTLVETTGGDDVGNYNITNQGTTTADVTQKDLTISGITASNKTYDGTVSATTDDSGATFTGLVTVDGVADDVTVSSTGTFDNKNVGVGKEVTLVETTGGDDVGNYNITNQGTTTADVTQKDLTISGITASNKTYDGTVSATTDDSGATFTGLVTVDGVADDVTVSSTGTFDNKNVGVGKKLP
jgi:hypothetical protein